MSWDVVLIRTKDNSESIGEIDEANIIPFKQAEIVEEIKKIAPVVSAEFCCDDLAWQIMDTKSWSIEFNVGDKEENESVMLHIRGGEEPSEVLMALQNDLGTRLIDCSTGDFLDFNVPSGFERWKAYRDKIVSGKQ